MTLSELAQYLPAVSGLDLSKLSHTSQQADGHVLITQLLFAAVIAQR
jgi:hypothetical protein